MKDVAFVRWFLEILPQLKEEERPIEFVQHPGETVFIPRGWWHCVLNLELTVSVYILSICEPINVCPQVTQNFLSATGLADAVELLSRGGCRYYSQFYPLMNRSPVSQSPNNHTLRLHCRWIGALVKAVWNTYSDLRVRIVAGCLLL